jgi:hypothetical protein
LSPNSAMKTRKKVEIIALNILFLLASFIYGYFWQTVLLISFFICYSIYVYLISK